MPFCGYTRTGREDFEIVVCAMWPKTHRRLALASDIGAPCICVAGGGARGVCLSRNGSLPCPRSPTRSTDFAKGPNPRACPV
jgi:hypothetical protein